jgi:hypothetical protein
MRIYFDNCSLNRPYDDLSNNTARMECEAILSIIDNCNDGNWSYLSSDILFDEIIETPDNDKKEKVMILYDAASEHIDFTEDIYIRAKELEDFNIKSFDALHIASAEIAKADVFLTTDRKLIKTTKRAGVKIPVKNPLIWLTEVLYDRES